MKRVTDYCYHCGDALPRPRRTETIADWSKRTGCGIVKVAGSGPQRFCAEFMKAWRAAGATEPTLRIEAVGLLTRVVRAAPKLSDAQTRERLRIAIEAGDDELHGAFQELIDLRSAYKMLDTLYDQLLVKWRAAMRSNPKTT